MVTQEMIIFCARVGAHSQIPLESVFVSHESNIKCISMEFWIHEEIFW